MPVRLLDVFDSVAEITLLFGVDLLRGLVKVALVPQPCLVCLGLGLRGAQEFLGENSTGRSTRGLSDRRWCEGVRRGVGTGSSGGARNIRGARLEGEEQKSRLNPGSSCKK